MTHERNKSLQHGVQMGFACFQKTVVGNARFASHVDCRHAVCLGSCNRALTPVRPQILKPAEKKQRLMYGIQAARPGTPPRSAKASSARPCL